MEDNNSKPQRRLQTILSHLSSGNHKILETLDCANDEDEVVLVSCARTPIARAKEGYYRDTPLEDLVSTLINHIISTTKIDKSLIDEVCFGKVRGPSGQGARDLRIASLLSGLPITTSCHTVNRQCGSGLQAIATSIASIKQGFFEVVIAGGMEKMSEPETLSNKTNFKALQHEKACGCYLPMGSTSEIVAKKYNISRKRQDEISLQSHLRAAKATDEGKFKDEMVPIEIYQQNPTNFHLKSLTVYKDQGIRSDTTIELLSKLPPAFQKGGSTTAGNSSQVSDGAAAVLLMKRSKAKQLGLPIFGKMLSYACIGVEPSEMGIGPAYAIPIALKRANLRIEDIDVFEINEAFASQYIYCVEKLNIPWEKVNVNGGAIAMGHPVGCTGARLVVSALHELKRTKKRYAVISMCAGSGMGCAAVFENCFL